MYGTSVDAVCSAGAGGGAPTDASWSPWWSTAKGILSRASQTMMRRMNQAKEMEAFVEASSSFSWSPWLWDGWLSEWERKQTSFFQRLFIACFPNCCFFRKDILSVKSLIPKVSQLFFRKLKEMKLMFDKSANCGVNATRRANSVVINDASGGPIRVCLKHVYGCLN